MLLYDFADVPPISAVPCSSKTPSGWPPSSFLEYGLSPTSPSVPLVLTGCVQASAFYSKLDVTAERSHGFFPCVLRDDAVAMKVGRELGIGRVSANLLIIFDQGILRNCRSNPPPISRVSRRTPCTARKLSGTLVTSRRPSSSVVSLGTLTSNDNRT